MLRDLLRGEGIASDHEHVVALLLTGKSLDKMPS